MILVKLFAGVYKLMFVPAYIFRVDLLVKFRDFSFVLIVYISFMCRLLNDRGALDLIYILIFFPVSIFAWLTAYRLRRKKMLSKLRNEKHLFQSH